MHQPALGLASIQPKMRECMAEEMGMDMADVGAFLAALQHFLDTVVEQASLLAQPEPIDRRVPGITTRSQVAIQCGAGPAIDREDNSPATLERLLQRHLLEVQVVQAQVYQLSTPHVSCE